MKRRFIFFLLFLTISCTDKIENHPSCNECDVKISLSVKPFVEINTSKTLVVPTIGSFKWENGDIIGIFSNRAGSMEQNPSQVVFSVPTSTLCDTVSFSQTVGWSLVPDQDYTYIAYYPYSKLSLRDSICIDYSGQVQAENGDMSHIRYHDYLFSNPAIPSSSTEASFTFNHIGALVNLKLTIPEAHHDKHFYKVKLVADSQLFVSSASYSVSSIISSGYPELERTFSSEITLDFSTDGFLPEEGIIDAWLMMAPTSFVAKDITVKLYSSESPLPTLEGKFTPTEDIQAGMKYQFIVNNISYPELILPDAPSSGQSLNILLFGHSFGLDCTEYLPSLVDDAGISNVHFGRLYYGNCSLLQWWERVSTKKGDFTYYECLSGSKEWHIRYSSIEYILKTTSWDIIIFQQSHGFEGAGTYATYQPYLNNLMKYVIESGKKYHNKAPLIGWNMFWGHNSDYSYSVDKDATEMYYAIVSATKEMMDDTGITLIIPSGTALHNARGTSLNGPTAQILQRDGDHASYGIGRYVTACSWFQTLIAPIYGVDIMGNSYLPYPYVLNKNYSFDGDQVTSERASILQKCAVEAAKHPFVITPIVE